MEPANPGQASLSIEFSRFQKTKYAELWKMSTADSLNVIKTSHMI
jgi:hypothetical protein